MAHLVFLLVPYTVMQCVWLLAGICMSTLHIHLIPFSRPADSRFLVAANSPVGPLL